MTVHPPLVTMGERVLMASIAFRVHVFLALPEMSVKQVSSRSDQNEKATRIMITRYENPGDWNFDLGKVVPTLLFF